MTTAGSSLGGGLADRTPGPAGHTPAAHHTGPPGGPGARPPSPHSDPGNSGTGTPLERHRGAAAAARRWWPPVALAALVLLCGAIIAVLEIAPPATGNLDPASVGPDGSHALAALLTARGHPVTTVRSAAAAAARSRSPRTTLVVTSPGLLGPASLSALSRVRADLLLVAPTPAALARLAPAVVAAGPAPVSSGPPACGLPAATLAGPADMGGTLLRSTAAGAWRCYPAPAGGGGTGGAPGAAGSHISAVSLVRYTAGGRSITVLGTGTPLTNRALGLDGNAALALNLLATGQGIVWLVPRPPPPATAGAAGGSSLGSVVPGAVYLVLAELGVAVLLAAAWRMRRFGPLVYEPLVVVVRASETVRGHGTLYRSRRARGRAAAVLRGATLARIAARLGLPPDPPPAAVCRNVAALTGRDAAAVEAILYGPVPGDDGALVALAGDLDSLEGQVLIR